MKKMTVSQEIAKVGNWLECLIDMSAYAIDHKAKNKELAVQRLLSLIRIEKEMKKCSSFIEKNYKRCRKYKEVAKMYYGDALSAYKWKIHYKAKKSAFDEVKKYYKEIETLNEFIDKFEHVDYNADFTFLELKVSAGNLSFVWQEEG